MRNGPEAMRQQRQLRKGRITAPSSYGLSSSVPSPTSRPVVLWSVVPSSPSALRVVFRLAASVLPNLGIWGAPFRPGMKETGRHSDRAFTLVEIMIVVAVIALLAAIAVPGFMRARKRSQAARILNDLRFIDSAVDQYALETSKTTGSPVAITDWTNYLKTNTTLYLTGADMFGNSYGPQTVDSLPAVATSVRTALSDVADSSFWSPYN